MKTILRYVFSLAILLLLTAFGRDSTFGRFGNENAEGAGLSRSVMLNISHRFTARYKTWSPSHVIYYERKIIDYSESGHSIYMRG